MAVSTYERLVNATAEPQNWLHYWGNFQGTHYSGLKEITASNVRSDCRPPGRFQMPGSSTLEATPLVVDGVMYTTASPATVVALDARTGRQIWRYTRPQKVRNPYEINPFNRGVALLGHRLFVGTLDAALVALDARTGCRCGKTQVADTMLGYSITSAPLVVKDKVIVGVTGGEFGARGFLDAYDAATGKRLWRWYSVPAPGEFGNDTWAGDSWKLGGSPMWLTGSYDPELNTVLLDGRKSGTADRSLGRAAMATICSVIRSSRSIPTPAQRKWHYQFTPNDGHDWDSAQDVILVDRDLARPESQAAAARRSQRHVLRARPHERKVPVGHAVRLPELEQGLRRERPADPIPGSNSSPEGSFFVYPTRGRRHELPGAVLQSPHRLDVSRVRRERTAGTSARPSPYEPGRQYIGRGPATGGAGGPRPASRRRRPASRRSIPKPARRCGTSRSSRAR